MKVISARSPFQIVINETGQSGSKVELFIWNKGTTEPTVATYVMSANIASVTQTETNFNISPYVLEYINQINPTTVSTPTVEDNSNWCFVRVKRYKNVSGAFTLLDNILYVGVNAYTEVENNLNYDIALGLNNVLLANPTYRVQYFSTIPYYNYLLVSDPFNEYRINYYNASNTLLISRTISGSVAANYFNYKLPLVYNNSVYCEIEDDFNGVAYRIYTDKIEECKYTPVTCNFINKLGGWQQLTLFKAQKNNIDIKGSKYNLMQANVSYNPLIGQTKFFNINGNQTITCNTGWVYENYNNLIKELMLSDTILINNKPATIKTQSLQYKTDLLDKNINFTLEFEYSNNLLNNII
jgi:hypothetical protein